MLGIPPPPTPARFSTTAGGGSDIRRTPGARPSFPTGMSPALAMLSPVAATANPAVVMQSPARPQPPLSAIMPPPGFPIPGRYSSGGDDMTQPPPGYSRMGTLLDRKMGGSSTGGGVEDLRMKMPGKEVTEKDMEERRAEGIRQDEGQMRKLLVPSAGRRMTLRCARTTLGPSAAPTLRARTNLDTWRGLVTNCLRYATCRYAREPAATERPATSIRRVVLGTGLRRKWRQSSGQSLGGTNTF